MAVTNMIRTAAFSTSLFLMAFCQAVPGTVHAAETGSGYLPVSVDGRESSDSASQPKPSVQGPERQYLTDLFAASFPVQGVNILEGEAGQRQLIIRSEDRISRKQLRQFSDALQARSVNIYGAYYFGPFSWERAGMETAITVTRPATGEVDTVEVSRSVAVSPKTGHPIIPVSVDVDEISIALAKGFGSNWQRVRIIPASEPSAPEPKVGRFPGAHLREVVKDGDAERLHLIYAARTKLEEVATFYKERLGQQYNVVITSGDPTGEPSPTDIFGIKTSGRYITITGYNFIDNRLRSTQVILKNAIDPNLSQYVEIDLQAN